MRFASCPEWTPWRGYCEKETANLRQVESVYTSTFPGFFYSERFANSSRGRDKVSTKAEGIGIPRGRPSIDKARRLLCKSRPFFWQHYARCQSYNGVPHVINRCLKAASQFPPSKRNNVSFFLLLHLHLPFLSSGVNLRWARVISTYCRGVQIAENWAWFPIYSLTQDFLRPNFCFFKKKAFTIFILSIL